jgi:phenylacetate-CoA ligase
MNPWLWSAVAGEAMAASVMGAPAILAQQSRRLHGLLRHAKARSPLFRRLLEGLDPAGARLQDLPVTRKRDLMAHFDEWVTDPCLRLADLRRFLDDADRIGEPGPGGHMVWQSSGSSGEPGVFVQDERAMAVYDALESQRRPWTVRRLADPWFSGERIVYVGATNGHFAGIASIRRLRRLNPVLRGALRDLSFLQPTAPLVSQLNALAPTILSTYPSSAVLLAQEQRAGRLRIRPDEVWTGGESMSQAMRRYVEQAFGCTVVDSYGASEFLALASPCRCQCLHLNCDWAILESVDAQGRPVPDGQLGATALLTNLANHVQPLIRYDLGDRILVHAGRCECGSPFPTIEVHGRHDDTLQLVSRGRRVSVLPLAVCTVLEEAAGLVDFQVVQRGPAAIEILAGDGGGVPLEQAQRAVQALQGFLDSVGACGVEVACLDGPRARHGAGGKVQRVVAMRAGADLRGAGS